nr:bZIP transcription factor [Aspergillus pulvericola]
MDDIRLSADLPVDWTDMLSQLDASGDASVAQPVSMAPRGAFELSGVSATPLARNNDHFQYQPSVSELNNLDRILGLPSSGADSGTPGPHTLFSDPHDLFTLPPITPPTANLDETGAAAQPDSAEAQSSSGEPQPTFEKSAEVKQLRQKYHEKYKERNRLAAGKSRQKQVDLIALLEAERRDEERRRRALEHEIQKIQKDLYAMKQELLHHIRVSNCMNMMSQGARLQTLGLLAQDILR